MSPHIRHIKDFATGLAGLSLRVTKLHYYSAVHAKHVTAALFNRILTRSKLLRICSPILSTSA